MIGAEGQPSGQRGRFGQPTIGFDYKVVLGNAGKHDHVRKGVRERMANMVTATDWSNPKTDLLPYVIDNGAFGAWTRKEPFPEDAFRATLRKADESGQAPVWVVIPDKVAAGVESLAFSESWIDELDSYDWPMYLAVQDGMRPAHLLARGLVNEISGIFVGGTVNWKIRTAEFWIDWASRHDLPVHIGRCGTLQSMLWAHRIGADSIDSSSWTRNDRLDIIDRARSAIAYQTRITDVVA